ncbi:ethanolamine ammonia-lyase reactivating factor EutA [Fictibacillus fluitans]|uniref:Ethanolamine ammonia-lyase reactivating factor EutA n=1 Tax=Fictibacillus fluitans TaxID=3058422 RepID=A0ABT8I2C3_9BACL|nr:ethanolamine ammonia-lyase reactivating factor EutA [Fictibacillus sp. NE201]MDN4526637.1 ethanolamine ammonia-lyase reactivating factor EutA [Fictibacillus sp. NE201]
MSSSGNIETILSVGIDIGTSTTKIIVSRFSLENIAGASHVPKIEIVKKEILYKSPIYRTPLLDNKKIIDIQEVHALVRKEYEKAGVMPTDVKTGAVIITGESATKENAQEIIHDLSSEAGEFLVATAGPDLESIIAAKGSGAYQYSLDTGKCIANIDIGGGTTNIAVYKKGILLGTCTLHVGGRLIEFQDGEIAAVSKPVKEVARMIDQSLSSQEDVESVLDFMVNTLTEILNGSIKTKENPLILGHLPEWGNTVEAIMFSGGVSECLYKHETAQSELYDDIGSCLANKIKESSRLAEWEWITPLETVRATVLGAGTQTTEISGATIQVDAAKLPLKNLPVFHLHLEDLQVGEESVKQAVQQALEMYDPNQEGINFALYISGLKILRFSEVQQIALWLLQAFQMQINNDQPLVIVMANDMAKVLGQSIQSLKPERPIVCIDQIKVENGDYLDIGSMLRAEVVPVVVKTLAFHS